ncbi:MAG: UDP-N-acetylmuramoyl-L-alanyl-D-glutamate--2,6-diaminopimelate ligase [Pseudomonadota bacterium]
MKLSELVRQLSEVVSRPATGGDPDICQVTYRSQEVAQGALFVAVAGTRANGHDFIRDAEKKGAAAIIAEKPVQTSVPLVVVTDSRKALAEAAAAFYEDPSGALTLVGITGTNGKTTTAHIVEHLLARAGHVTGVIGTLGYRFGGASYPLPVTTPESRDLQKILRRMLDAGVTHVVMEVSSHAIDQHRIWRCRFDVGIFTNLSHDHLDYHGDMAAYWECKKQWFTDILTATTNRKSATAVINTRDKRGRELAADLRGRRPAPRLLTVDRASGADVVGSGAIFRQDGLTAAIDTPAGPITLSCPLVGGHNLDNVMGAIGAACALGIAPEVIAAALTDTPQVPGRLEAVRATDERFVFVDYAHTPDALENVLTTLRAVADKRLICVFGCGGDRDRGKRAVMGAIAGRLADLSVITADNPRTESTAAILDDIAAGMRTITAHRYLPWTPPDGFTRPGYLIEPNRLAAIQLALAAMRAGDVLLIAGKGHETYQIIGSHTIAFDDRQAAIQSLAAPAVPAPQDPDRPLPWTGDRLLEAVGGAWVQTSAQQAQTARISTDTRTLSSTDCFLALHGETHDGHDFIPAALAAGVTSIIFAAQRTDEITALLRRHPAVDAIAVESPLVALGRLAAYHRVRTGTPVIAVTGSNGKTTTRAMMAAVVSQRFDTLATRGNLNNEIGLPLTLLEAAPRHAWAVLEMGMNHPGEIGRLAAICAPSVGVITNIGPAHLEFLGTLEGVMHAKGELLEAMAADAMAVLNGDDPFTEALIQKCACPVTTFGLGARNTVRAADVRSTTSGIAFTLVTPEATLPVQLPVFGRFMVPNALAAAAVGWHLGIAPEGIAAGLESFTPVGGRMRRMPLANGVTLIDDTYNANPGSMAAAIACLAEMAGGAATHLVIGDMRELGAASDALHRDMGRTAADCRIDCVYATGEHAAAVADGAVAGGMPRGQIATGDQSDLLEALCRRLTRGSWVLLKGSRAMGMEKMIAGISDRCGAAMIPDDGERR